MLHDVQQHLDFLLEGPPEVGQHRVQLIGVEEAQERIEFLVRHKLLLRLQFRGEIRRSQARFWFFRLGGLMTGSPGPRAASFRPFPEETAARRIASPKL